MDFNVNFQNYKSDDFVAINETCTHCGKDVVIEEFDKRKIPEKWFCQNFTQNKSDPFNIRNLITGHHSHESLTSKSFSQCYKMYNRNKCPDRYIKHLRIPKRFTGSTLDNFNTTSTIVETLRSIIEKKNFTDFVLFQGDTTGTGKTHLGISFVVELTQKNPLDVIFTTFNDFMAEIYTAIQKAKEVTNSVENVIKKYSNVDILLLDDLGAEHRTDYSASVLYKIINSRYNSEKMTVVTTNLNAKEIVETYDRRILSRIISGHMFSLSGKDKRVGDCARVKI